MTKRYLCFLLLLGAITAQAQPTARLSRDELHDRVLGMLVGSAIGDAMGAPTEMWSREMIGTMYGSVTGLDSMVREPSAEGTWYMNLPAGGTTDDTRWKKLTVSYLLTQRGGPLDARAFAGHILTQYRADVQRLKNTSGDDPGAFEANTRRMAWLQEWAKVAKPYAAQNWPAYVDALSGFYGGEMTCAGLLYAPVLGTLFPGQPERAYAETFRLAIFDLGYARDLTALTGAMMAAAMTPGATPESVLNVLRDVDPQGYFQSRLVGRMGYRALERARSVVYKAAQWTPPAALNTAGLVFPRHGRADTLALARRQYAFTLLDGYNQDSPIRSGEIFQITLTAMLYGGFDFLKSLQFAVNFGRDNDTTGAIIGAILGACHGADKLPKDLVNQVLTVNKKHTETDLVKLADDLTGVIWARQGK
ncbi:ADP-ribosylglycohydrolase family protein [Fibrella sp. HMF5335]|uniref:ADP-ribosylglycohydrolase family protein n=1 Tax=Fibrella rubiginis TaxID=2817060 RepID=A0A939GGB6_9BACT|nr:ADP-ribosylglycohydrolase family protein [Fibrella rubiginis]MBO0936965.1 ADP-ribosylglycohydrolase family protein [Fibrella rubiginis]